MPEDEKVQFGPTPEQQNERTRQKAEAWSAEILYLAADVRVLSPEAAEMLCLAAAQLEEDARHMIRAGRALPAASGLGGGATGVVLPFRRAQPGRALGMHKRLRGVPAKPQKPA
jgi:hypothetical protein